MQCPVCKTEAVISSNKLVHRKDGTFAYKMEIKCRSNKCPNYGKVINTVFNSVEIVDDEE